MTPSEALQALAQAAVEMARVVAYGLSDDHYEAAEARLREARRAYACALKGQSHG